MSLPFRRSFVSLSLAAIVALCGAACSGGSSPSLPDGTSPAGAGATLVGTVETGSPLATVRAQSASPGRGGIRVSVVGTPMSATTDDSGRFVLSGLPAGRVELRFEGSGIDARVEIGGLVDGQTLTIAIQLSGASPVVVRPGEEAEIEIEGSVESVTPPTLRVQGRTITTDGNTRIQGARDEAIALSALRVGQPVKVEGMLRADGSILARKLELENEDDDEPQGEVEFTGTIGAKGASSLVVAGRAVTVDGSTRILGGQSEAIAFSALQVGQRVEVEGTAQANGNVAAQKIKLED